MISKGFLRQAKQKAHILLQTLLPYAKQGIPIVGLEPSCLLTLKDDFKGLLGNGEDVGLLISQCHTIDEFLFDHELPITRKKVRKAYVQGHCHQRALVGMEKTLAVLRRLPGLEVHEIQSGCCGMAGSFGYEKEHEEISMKIGELRLFPAVRESADDDLIIANGISCRSQIAFGTKRSSQHLIKVVSEYLEESLS